MDITRVDNALHVKANLDRESCAYTIDAQDMVVQKLKTIYALLETKENETSMVGNANRFLKQQYKAVQGLLQQQDKSQQTSSGNQISVSDETKLLLETVGQSIFQPVHALIETATEIEFVITEDEMLFPLDALFYQGSPLFLQKPVVYKFSKKTNGRFAMSASWNGCMIADPTTAPGKAVLNVKKYFPNSQHFNSREIRSEDIAKLGSAKFLLISASGSPEGIELPHLAIRSWSLASLKPELVYLNTGKLGLGIDFLKAFQQAGTHYYIAPIFGYEFDSIAALTMERFFRSLSTGNSPSYAMYLTRKTIYNECLLKDNDFQWVMWQAFPYRVYQLN
ncbi:MAG: hypothetical protein C4519_13270 [Desulfobacteraceae bacterium]|nr:MAG: hypothetical protein C4519_13270 [Desulfobacteraceae bacterium]